MALGADMSTKLKLMGVDVASIGDAHAMTPDALSYFYADEDALIYKKIVVNAQKPNCLAPYWWAMPKSTMIYYK